MQTLTLGTWAGAPIEWQILSRNDGILLLSRYVLDARKIFPDRIYMSWAQSSVREWLNTAFPETAFTPEEQTRIAVTQVVTPESAPTDDRIFLLSADEVTRLLPRAEERIIPAAPHAVRASRDLRDFTELLPFYGVHRSCWWWLRNTDPTGHSEPNQMGTVWSDGTICYEGHFVNYERGIRPALRLQ
ncbi:MAG: hypothetical protein IJ236_06545 [Oscillospiraceae bacterium]|nr:hypothetical protein [Oscillospiraceae bacterium]